MTAIVNLGWIDQYLASIGRELCVRETDGVLILMPNRCYKLNAQAVKLLSWLLSGKSIADVLSHAADPARVAQELDSFFQDLRRVLSGTLCEGHESPTLERITFGPGYTALPVLSELAVTSRCNIRCQFCYGNCTCRADNDEPDLSRATIARLFRTIRHQAEVPSVSLTGGEPMLRTDLVELVADATDTGLRVNLITNGTCATAAVVRRLVAAGLRSVQISVEGSTAAIHDAVTQSEGSFARSIAGVRLFAQSGISAHIHTTLNQLNLEDSLRMPALARELGLKRLSMNMLIPVGRGKNERLLVRYAEVGEHVLRLADLAASLGLELHWYSPTPMCLFNPIAHGLGNKGCAACDGLLSIDSRGRVLPCSSYPQPLGSLLELAFADIWQSQEARRIRNRGDAPAQCQACDQLHLCTGACPLYWQSVGTRELPRCPQEPSRRHTWQA